MPEDQNVNKSANQMEDKYTGDTCSYKLHPQTNKVEEIKLTMS